MFKIMKICMVINEVRRGKRGLKRERSEEVQKRSEETAG